MGLAKENTLLQFIHDQRKYDEQVPLHNVLFGQYVFLPTKQAETYLKIYVLMYHLTYIWTSLFGWKENLIFKETKSLKNCSRWSHLYPWMTLHSHKWSFMHVTTFSFDAICAAQLISHEKDYSSHWGTRYEGINL